MATQIVCRAVLGDVGDHEVPPGNIFFLHPFSNVPSVPSFVKPISMKKQIYVIYIYILHIDIDVTK